MTNTKAEATRAAKKLASRDKLKLNAHQSDRQRLTAKERGVDPLPTRRLHEIEAPGGEVLTKKLWRKICFGTKRT